jgi:hypothetical protein
MPKRRFPFRHSGIAAQNLITLPYGAGRIAGKALDLSSAITRLSWTIFFAFLPQYVNYKTDNST